MPAKISKIHQRVLDSRKQSLGMAAFTGQMPSNLKREDRKQFARDLRKSGMRIPKNNFWDETREYSNKLRSETKNIVHGFVGWLHPRVTHPEVQAHLATRPDNETIANLIRSYDADEAAMMVKFDEISAMYADKVGGIKSYEDLQLQMNIMTTYEEVVKSFSTLLEGTQAELFARLAEYDHLFEEQAAAQQEQPLTDEQNPDIITDVVVN